MDPHIWRAKAGQLARTYIQQFYEDTGCSPEDRPEAMKDREKWGERVKDIWANGMTWRWWCIYNCIINIDYHYYCYYWFYFRFITILFHAFRRYCVWVNVVDISILFMLFEASFVLYLQSHWLYSPKVMSTSTNVFLYHIDWDRKCVHLSLSWSDPGLSRLLASPSFQVTYFRNFSISLDS